jgi:hypothetical protein
MHRIAVAFPRLIVVRLKSNALEILVENHVHDARQSIRTVRRGRTAGHDLGAFEQQRRYEVQVDVGRIGAWNMSAPVNWPASDSI